MVKPLIPKQTRLTKDGSIISIVAWEVPKSKDYPEGINYAFALIHKNKRILGYDNNTNEGHHRHYLEDDKEVKEPVKFKSLEDVYKRFMKEVSKGDKDEN